MDNLKDDVKLFSRIVEHARDLKAKYSERDSMFEEYEEIFLMKWVENNSKAFRRAYKTLVQSPDGRNAVLGAVRLMLAAEPIFKVELLKGEEPEFDQDLFEKWLSEWWKRCDYINRRPLLSDIALSAFLYGEIHQGVTLMSSLIERYSGTMRKRIERKAKYTPVLIENWTPKSGYPEFDQFDLSAYYRELELTYSEIASRFGDLYPKELEKFPRTQKTTLHMFYDLEYTAYWLENTPIYIGRHELPEIPINVTITDGSFMFDDPSDQRQPMLYGLVKSNLAHQQSIAMTVLYNVAYGIGANALFKHIKPPANPTKELELNFDEFGGVVELENGEDVQPMMNSNLVPPIFMDAYNLAKEKGNDSTIYPQAFGAPINRNTTFSEVSLLSQTGRLPLIAVQKAAGMSISRVVELSMMLLSDTGERIEYRGQELKVPEDVIVKVDIEAKLPQDKLQLANIATMLKTNELADNEWIQNNILNITDANGVKRKTWREQAEKALFVTLLQQKVGFLAQQNAAMQQMLMQQQMQQPQMPQGQEMQVPPGEQVPPEIAQMMQQRGAKEAAMRQQMASPMKANPMMSPGQENNIRGIPPEQAGLVPGVGGAFPEEVT